MFTQKQIDQWLVQQFRGGGGFVIKFLPTKTCTQEFVIKADLAAIIDAIQAMLVDTKVFSDQESQIIYGLTKSGTLHLNPVVMIVKISIQAEELNISLKADAKEGLINQNTSQRAVEEIRRILERLTKSP